MSLLLPTLNLDTAIGCALLVLLAVTLAAPYVVEDARSRAEGRVLDRMRGDAVVCERATSAHDRLVARGVLSCVTWWDGKNSYWLKRRGET